MTKTIYRKTPTVGDYWKPTASIPLVSVSDPAAQGFMTIKTSVAQADPGVLQKKVTTANVAGTGQITSDGSSGSTSPGFAQVRFDFPPADTLTLTPGVDYVFDIQIKTAAGEVLTTIGGVVCAEPQVTIASS